MAKAAAVETPEATPGAKKPSMKLVIMIALAMSLIGAGAGFGLGFVSFSSTPQTGEEASKADGAATEKSAAEGEKGHGEAAPEAKDGDPAEGDKSTGHEAAPDKAGEEAAAGDHGTEAPAAEGGHGGEGEAAGPASVALEPVVTNIAAPADVWIRFESVLKASGPVAKDTSDLIHQDFMAFFRTMRLEDLEGASSFNDLKAELLARANVRAEGKIEAVYIKALLFE